LARDAVLDGIRDVTLNFKNLQGQPVEKAMTDSILQNLFKDLPEVANRALSLLDEENPWVPETGDLRELMTIRAGAAEAALYVNEVLEGKEINQDVSFILTALAEENPTAFAALSGVSTTADRAVAIRRGVWKITSELSSNLARIVTEVDEASPVRAIQDEMRGVSQLSDRLLIELMSAKDEVTRSKLQEQVRSGLTAEASGLPEATLEQSVMEPPARFTSAVEQIKGLRYLRPVGPLEAMGLSFYDPAKPDKMGPFLDLISTGKGRLEGPNVSSYQEAVKRTPASPGRTQLVKRQQERQALLEQRTKPSTPPAGAGGPAEPPNRYGAVGTAAGAVKGAAQAVGGAAKTAGSAVAGAAGKAIDTVGGAMEPVAEAIIGEEGLNQLSQTPLGGRP
jgi:hypothetical protein